ncbi:MAG: hypothetical protein Q9186_004882 [Xanthomendoza sp. 1 TL-2023]
MAPSIINVLLTSFPGLGLPPTLSVPVPSSIAVAELRSLLGDRLPQSHHRLIFTTTSNKQILGSSSAPLSDLLSTQNDTLLPVRLSVPTCGGKGGFGSQLRAAGGRMSSKKKRNQGDENSSNRNLDGRRLRTVAEAKALAEYLALKPEMEKKEKEARRKRWQQVVELAEKRESEIKNGLKGRVDGKWAEEKDEAGERTRDAVLAAIKSGDYHDVLGSSPRLSLAASSAGGLSTPSENDEANEETEPCPSKSKTLPSMAIHNASRSYIGFDEDEDLSSDEDS